jgi:hypothetical protein
MTRDQVVHEAATLAQRVTAVVADENVGIGLVALLLLIVQALDAFDQGRLPWRARALRYFVNANIRLVVARLVAAPAEPPSFA